MTNNQRKDKKNKEKVFLSIKNFIVRNLKSYLITFLSFNTEFNVLMFRFFLKYSGRVYKSKIQLDSVENIIRKEHFFWKRWMINFSILTLTFRSIWTEPGNEGKIEASYLFPFYNHLCECPLHSVYCRVFTFFSI